MFQFHGRYLGEQCSEDARLWLALNDAGATDFSHCIDGQRQAKGRVYSFRGRDVQPDDLSQLLQEIHDVQIAIQSAALGGISDAGSGRLVEVSCLEPVTLPESSDAGEILRLLALRLRDAVRWIQVEFEPVDAQHCEGMLQVVAHSGETLTDERLSILMGNTSVQLQEALSAYGIRLPGASFLTEVKRVPIRQSL